MAPRGKKDDNAELMVSIEQYTRTRDALCAPTPLLTTSQVIMSLTSLQTGLTHVQTGLNDLLRAYMQHTTSILAGEVGDLDKLQLPANVTAPAIAAMEAATTAATGMAHAVSGPSHTHAHAHAHALALNGAPPDAKAKKRKREKKEKDPNAPKKPLTAAFLYAQTARPIVKADLEAALDPGAILEKNAVNLEVTKRWNDLPEEEKEKWKASYRHSNEQYKLQLAEYLSKTGDKPADVHVDEDVSDPEDVEMAEAVTVDSDLVSGDDDDDDNNDDNDDNDDDDEILLPTRAPSPPPAKTPRAYKRQKTTTSTTTTAAAAAPSTPSSAKDTPVPLPGSARPSVQMPASSLEPVAKKEKKKAKSAKEASPEETAKTTKKIKSGRSTRGAEAEVDKENVAAAASTEKKKEKRDRSKRKAEGAAT
ncbi:hypothetical protein ACEQ8H_002364 [Pleosporales sp. CAS-2024a]